MWYSLFREKYQIPTTSRSYILLYMCCTIFISFLRLFIAQTVTFNSEYNNIMLLYMCVCACVYAFYIIFEQNMNVFERDVVCGGIGAFIKWLNYRLRVMGLWCSGECSRRRWWGLGWTRGRETINLMIKTNWICMRKSLRALKLLLYIYTYGL